jgi:predicted dehydrogenase/aryl-alcohol dehydrogenase-like predicted oxidoreductase
MTEHLRWGIIGPGGIAHNFAKGVLHSKTGKLVAVGSRRQEKADLFGKEYNVPNRHGSYEALLADPEVDAVYVATPHPMHAEWAIKSAEAGKHVLCEKPLAINHAEAMAIVEAAHENDVFLMEAFMYRCHPQTRRLVELVRQGAIGRVCMIQATFSFQAGTDPNSRLMNNALAGGGIMDVGCYPVSFARLIAGAAVGADFAEPFEVKGCGRLGETNVDEWAAAVLKFPGDIVAQVATGVRLNQDNAARIYGLDGTITVPWPWIPGREGGEGRILLQRKGAQQEEIVVKSDEWLYGIEADTVAANVERRQAPSPAMSWGDSLGNARVLDRWRAEIGLSYAPDRAEGWTLTAARRPLKVRASHPMKYGKVEGVRKQVSRLLMGVDNQTAIAHASVMFDHFFERGGNAFDTAYIYGGGRCEQVLGQWVKNHGIREQVVLLGKGAHTPYCTPEDLTRQLTESLARLQTEYLDVYMMHRDNPQVPVGEFIDVLNEHTRAGRMRAFGGSNWAIERVAEATAYAKKKGLQGFSAVSNNFSLARMVAPVWGGCIAASDAESRAWLKKTQMTLIPWSSQARGFFTERAHPDKRSDAELVRCWYSEDNWCRRERAVELAAKRGVLPINIALAYVLCQPFPTFPIIGPRTLEELRTSLPALGVELSPEELRWLNLE